MKQVQNIIDKYDVGAELTGVAPMFYITFKKDERLPTGQNGTISTLSLSAEASSCTLTIMDIYATDIPKRTWTQLFKAIDQSLAYVSAKYRR